MTALPSADDDGRRGPLACGPSPEDIRSALLPDEAELFVAEYIQALRRAKTSLDLTDLFAVLDRWQGRALLQADRDDFARVVRTAAERLNGEPVPVNEPLEVTRARIGM